MTKVLCPLCFPPESLGELARLMTKVLCPLCFPPESLEELARLTVSVMGNLFLAYNSLAFFQLDQLFNTVRESARDSRRPPELCVSLWSASVYPNYCPAGYDRGTLVNSIRCPPTLQKILKWTEKDVMVGIIDWNNLPQVMSVCVCVCVCVCVQSVDSFVILRTRFKDCLLYTSPSPRDRHRSRMPSSA